MVILVIMAITKVLVENHTTAFAFHMGTERQATIWYETNYHKYGFSISNWEFSVTVRSCHLKAPALCIINLSAFHM